MQPKRPLPIRLCSIALGAALVMSLTGCSWWRHLTGTEETVTTRPVLSESTSSYQQAVPAALQPMNRPVLQEQLPLVYLVEAAGTFRVANAETGEEVARFQAKPSQIIRVETKGVLLQNKPVLGAQLAPGTYAIYRDEPDAGIVVVEQTHSVPVAPATSQPAAEQPGSTADTPPPNPKPASTQPSMAPLTPAQ